ncbi:MAG: GTPase HflX [Proteobacteria bacterium]|nr:GTPase HflX [Pseudomonadota bacterium]MBQ4360652.1 GTPase HflX [Pseudomonadota bacterium]
MAVPIFGNTQGLNSREVEALKGLGLQKCAPNLLVSRELAHRMTSLSDMLHRKVGVLMGRNGHVECVILGDAERAYLPDIGRSRAGIGRLRGIRLVVTSIETAKTQTREILTMDELTDLAKLRLDFAVAVEANIVGAPGRSEYAHLTPSLKGVSIARNYVEAFEELPTNADEILKAVETELRATTDRAQATKAPPAILVHLDTGERDARERREEMLELCRTAGIEIVRVIEQKRRQPDPKSLVGSGKLQQIELHALDEDAEFVIFDRELSPAQTRVITQALPLKVLDRTQLILDIFAQRAKSLDGKLQVELAQLKYNLPKLIDRDTAMSRLTGGVGGRGPGETKLEMNRRKARERMNALERELKQRAGHRELQRKKRNAQNIPVFSLVGYTNAGKSTLLNALTQSDVYAENQLFATLDTTSRRLRFPRLQEVIFTDTVGFIRDLPKDLVAAFKATLEELNDADVLLHVIDSSSPQVHSQIAAVEAILKQLGLDTKPMIRIFNKTDLISPQTAIELTREYDGVAVSAKYKTSTLPLIDRIQDFYMAQEGDKKENAEIKIRTFEDAEILPFDPNA